MSTVNRGGLPERAAAPPRRWRGFRLSIGVSVGVVAALAAGYVQPAYADGTQVVFNDGQVADVLFGAAVRLSDPGVDYYRSVVTTAELLDWRAGHPAAPEADVEAHAAAVRQQMDAQLTDADKLLMPTELLGRQLQIVQATAGQFSLLPNEDPTSGNFTKVGQRIPIIITLDSKNGKDVVPGMSAEVTIHLH